MKNVYSDPEYAVVVASLKGELNRLQEKVGDAPYGG
jgi:hypothetical protein